MDFILECFEKLVETLCRLLGFIVCFSVTFWLASKITKDWRVANSASSFEIGWEQGGGREERVAEISD